MSDEALELLRHLSERMDELVAAREPSLVLTRAEAAKALRVSISQLYRLIAAGRIAALPSGIARAELDRYMRTPQTKLTAIMSRGKSRRTADQEVDRLSEMLKATRRKRRARPA